MCVWVCLYESEVFELAIEFYITRVAACMLMVWIKWCDFRREQREMLRGIWYAIKRNKKEVMYICIRTCMLSLIVIDSLKALIKYLFIINCCIFIREQRKVKRGSSIKYAYAYVCSLNLYLTDLSVWQKFNFQKFPWRLIGQIFKQLFTQMGNIYHKWRYAIVQVSLFSLALGNK